MKYLNYLYNRGHCIQTPPRHRSTDPKPVCHSGPLLMEIDVSLIGIKSGKVDFLTKAKKKVGYPIKIGLKNRADS